MPIAPFSRRNSWEKKAPYPLDAIDPENALADLVGCCDLPNHGVGEQILYIIDCFRFRMRVLNCLNLSATKPKHYAARLFLFHLRGLGVFISPSNSPTLHGGLTATMN